MDKPIFKTDNTNQKIEPALHAAMDQSPEGLWEVVVLYSGTPEELASSFPQFAITFLLGNYAILRLSKTQIQYLAASPGIIYIEMPKRLFFEVQKGKRASCITPLQEIVAGSAGVPLTGSGTVVAIIDSGIDYAHPDFRNADGSTRILFLWDQTIAENPDKNFFPPDGYHLGTLFEQKQIDRALDASGIKERESICPSRDLSGHGTHVAGIAAGNGRASGGANRGVAYEADLIIVKLGTPEANGFPSTTQLMQAVDFCVRTSIKINRPVAINISFGNTYGSHSGSSLTESYLDSVRTLGRCSIVVGSGNEGNSAGHAAAAIRDGQSKKIEFSVGDYEKSLSIQIWKNYWDEIRFALNPPGRSAAITIPDVPGSWRFETEGTGIFVYHGAPSPYNIYQEIYMELRGVQTSGYISSGIWNITLTAQSVSDGSCDLWMPSYAIRNPLTQFLSPETDTTLTIPSTASSVISVGAYDSNAGTFAPFSGRGYTWNTNRVKPELVAPGVDIVSAAPGGGYETRSGTSMATPFVTGSCALLMQWGIPMKNDPFLYGEKLKAYLIRGAKRLPFADSYPNPRSGYGALCVKDSIPK